MAAVDVAVIGGGIVGSATATFLAEAGLAVRLYEQTGIAAAASGRNSGVIQHPFDPVMAALYRSTLDEYRRLAASDEGTSFALGAEPAGLLLLGRERGPAERIAAEWIAAYPMAQAEVLEGSDLSRLEPALAPDLVACRLVVGYPVVPAAATEAYAAAAARAGADLRVGGAVRLATTDARVIGVERDGSMEPAAAVVVAAGPWTPDVVDPAGTWRPIVRSWGVVASVALDQPPRHALEAVEIDIEPTDAASTMGTTLDSAVDFSLVTVAGSSSLGSTFLPDAPDPADWVDALRRVGSGYVPEIGDASILGLRRCARPVSRDGRPLVGRAPWLDGLWIAAGHGPWGISTGPGTARLVADAILSGSGGSPSPIPPALAVDRFGAPDQRQLFASKR